MKDAQFLVSAKDFFSEEKTGTHHHLERLDPWAPAFRMTNTCLSNRYRIRKEVITDPERNVLIQQVEFQPLIGTMQDYSLFTLISPHIANSGFGNHAWVGEYNGIPMLFAARDSVYLAVMCSTHFSARSAGFEGSSDGWQDISQHNQMTWAYTSASDGNVALTGQIILPPDGRFTLATAFGSTAEEAAQQAYESVLKGYDACLKEYVEEWKEQTKPFRDLSAFSGDQGELLRSSIQVFLSHQDKRIQGGSVASLAFPWGDAQTADGNCGGYHLVWPRDLVQTAIARLALDDMQGARHILLYLASIQAECGGWHQNNWLDGRPFWDSVQLDETAFPIILAWRLQHAGALEDFDPWPMVRRAAAYLARTGPVTQQERWEENGGYSPSTLAAAIASLICAADMAADKEEHSLAEYLVGVADWWASNIDAWTYTTNSLLDPEIPAHYERLNTIVVVEPDRCDPNQGVIPIRNLSPDMPSEFPARDVVDNGFLQLVCYGIRSPQDPHILNSIMVADKVLKQELPAGPCWHRYNHDGYGEQPNGDPFRGWGVGQAWPLLTGERAHYELASGNEEEARRLARTMEIFAGDCSLLPEQVWTLCDIPEKGLFLGKPSGSATPLVWAHAEYVKLLRSIADGQVFDMIPIVASHYRNGPPTTRNVWRFNHKVSSTQIGEPLRIEVFAKARLHWSSDNWNTVMHENMIDSGLGTSYIDIPTATLEIPTNIDFTFYWIDSGKWEGTDFVVRVLGYPRHI
jgi:glucoamylase